MKIGIFEKDSSNLDECFPSNEEGSCSRYSFWLGSRDVSNLNIALSFMNFCSLFNFLHVHAGTDTPLHLQFMA